MTYRIFITLFLGILLSCQNKKETHQAADSLQTNIIFPLQTEHVHGPTIVELPNGDLLSAWFQGSGERWADDVRIMGARLNKGDTAWSAPFLMADVPDFPDINPMLFMDKQQRLWLMWYPVIANQWETSIPMYRISTNYQAAGAPQWDWQDVLFVKPGDKTERGIQANDRFVHAVHQQLDSYESYLKETLLPQIPDSMKTPLLAEWEGYKVKMDSLATGKNMIRSGRVEENGQTITRELGYPLSIRMGWQTKNKPFILQNRLIVPLYSDGLDCSLFALSDDWGKTWQFSNPVMGGAGIQPTIAVTKDSTLVAYLRDNGPLPKRMQRTESKDKGLTWTIAKDDLLPNPGAGFDMVTLQDGSWLMVYNHTEKGRHNLELALSADDGKTWQWRRSLENDTRASQTTASHYPAIIQGTDGRIHVVYSYHHNDREGQPHKTIKYASLPADWVKEQPAVKK
ncbi:neuraminidase (sialidase)-like protein [Rhodocytophaga rosea]|uniref:Neuraminidase (Sialidase)-like protein n=1 Tax=Rhodocytophaga rosea TaxID=2704465 RepID=A0A6C0GI19_9BACT|nr:exo-alpha-sialidase [Rhodocytophaga rosea]QHT67545.1 neuraminidase (sialidase)-like protein [Rhodocytophaga rosea]